ncbi:MAG: TlpA family protein disulfide reductase [Sphingomonadales bacterium]|nr:TlpA family protein disulfide reductase [Sphingomonadales bacterium]
MRGRFHALWAALALLASSTTPAAADPLDLGQYRGKVVYLDFWASWCGPCKQAFGFLNALRGRHPERDFVIVTVNLDRDHAAAQAFLRAVNTSLPVVYDPAGTLATRFKVSAMPTSVVIGRDGKVRFEHRGYFDAQQRQYEAHVTAALAEKS